MASPLRSVFRSDLFSGRVAVVTGGATGIGRAITTELVTLGCKVVIASRKMENLETAAKDINNDIRSSSANQTDLVYPFQCNIRKEEEVKSLMEYTVAKHGRLDYLVNNGGGQFISPISEISAKGWHAVVETNLTGTFYCCKHAFHCWMSANGGSIVNIIADMWKGFPNMGHTGAARAGVHNLMMTMAVEWAEFGIRINSIAPGVIYSPTAVSNYSKESDGSSFFKHQLHIIPARRLGLPEEVSGATCFLLSPAASYITGTTIRIDGGQSHYRSPYVASDEAAFPPPLEDSSLMSKL